MSSGKLDKDFIANFVLSPKVKEFLKTANICQSYEQITSLVFFCDSVIRRTLGRRYSHFMFLVVFCSPSISKQHVHLLCV